MKIFPSKTTVIICFIVIISGFSNNPPLFGDDSKRKPITKKLISLLKQKPEIRLFLIKSIEKAKKLNPDIKNNPVQDIDAYFDYIDNASELIPRNILENPKQLTRDQILQSICYFYFLIDQPLDELKNKKQFKNSLQYYENFSPWLRDFAKTWGNFLNTRDSWNKDIYKEFKEDPSFGLTKGWYESYVNWQSFNDFFSRKLKKPSLRPIASPEDPSVVVSPVDSVPQGTWKISRDSKIMVEKGLKVKLATYYSITDLLDKESQYKDAFAGGTLTHTFLNVNDYHRFHFAVGGTVKEVKRIQKNVALEVSWDKKAGKYIPVDSTGWQFTQTRGYVIVDTGLYGLVVLMPMGMAQVSSINFEKNVKVNSEHKKGSPLGYFLFGGSDFIMIFQKIAGFEIKAPEDSKGFKHILTGTEYGTMRGDKEYLKKFKFLRELDKMAAILKLPPLSSLDPSITETKVDIKIYKELEKHDIPEFKEEQVRHEAEATYKLWKIGDKVETVDNQGFVHKGEITEKNSRYIIIGEKKIFAIDFSKKMLPHLNKSDRQIAIDDFVKRQKKIFMGKRKRFKLQLRENVRNKNYKENGFVFLENKWMDYNNYKKYLTRKLKKRKEESSSKKK